MRIFDQAEYIRRKQQLTGDYKYSYNIIEDYIKFCFTNNEEKETECINEIFYEVNKAQNIQKPMSFVTEKGIKKYCDEKMSKYVDKKTTLSKYAQMTMFYLNLVWIVMLVRNIIEHGSGIFSSMSLGTVEIIVLIYSLGFYAAKVVVSRFLARIEKRIGNLELTLNVILIVIAGFMVTLFPEMTILDFPISFFVFLLSAVAIVTLTVYVAKIRDKIVSKFNNERL